MSEDDFRDFIKFVRPQISGLLEISHRWLTRPAALPKNRRKKKRLAGVQIRVPRIGRELTHCGVRSAMRVAFPHCSSPKEPRAETDIGTANGLSTRTSHAESNVHHGPVPAISRLRQQPPCGRDRPWTNQRTAQLEFTRLQPAQRTEARWREFPYSMIWRIGGVSDKCLKLAEREGFEPSKGF